MKLNKIQQAVVLLLLLCNFPTISFAQYPNAEREMMQPIRAAADAIFAKGNYVSPQQVKKLLDSLPKVLKGLEVQTDKGKKKIPLTTMYNNSLPAVGLLAMCSKANPLRPVKINQATAFFIADGICVTNYHVIHAYANSVDSVGRGLLLVRTADGEIYQLSRILALSPEADLAIIQLDMQGKKVKTLPLANRDPEIAEQIAILGNSQDLPYSFTVGIVSSKYNKTIGLPGQRKTTDRNLFSVSAEFAVGASGSPVLNAAGQVVGIVSSTQVIEQFNTGKPQSQMVIRSVVPVSALKILLGKK